MVTTLALHIFWNALVRPIDLMSVCYRVALNVLYCAKVNRDKAAGKYEQYRGLGDDRDPDFKFVL